MRDYERPYESAFERAYSRHHKPVSTIIEQIRRHGARRCSDCRRSLKRQTTEPENGRQCGTEPPDGIEYSVIATADYCALPRKGGVQVMAEVLKERLIGLPYRRPLS